MNVFGSRIRIRPTKQHDLSFLQTLWNDGTVMRYKGYPDGMHVTAACMERWWAMAPEAHDTEHSTSYSTPHSIIELLDGTPLGELAYSIDADHRARIDLKLAPTVWGQGYATEALSILLRDLFAASAVRKVVVEPSPANLAAHRLFTRCGFHQAPTENHPDRWECTRTDFAGRHATAAAGVA